MKNKIVINQYSYCNLCYEISIDLPFISDKTTLFTIYNDSKYTSKIRFKTERSNDVSLYHIYKDEIYKIVDYICKKFNSKIDDVSYISFNKSGWFEFVCLDIKDKFEKYILENKIPLFVYMCDVKLQNGIVYDIILEKHSSINFLENFRWLMDIIFENGKIINLRNKIFSKLNSYSFTYNGLQF